MRLEDDGDRSNVEDRRGSGPAGLPMGGRGVRLGLGGTVVVLARRQAGAEMGPFYCPADEEVYIDLRFYRELATRFGAPGEFAQTYAIAHEVGHHLQNVLGIEPRVREAQRRNPAARNALSVQMELQADCLAGVRARSAQRSHWFRQGFETGRIEACDTFSAEP